MKILLTLAGKEIRDGLRNRWIAGAVVVLAGLALTLAFLGSTPVGTVKAAPLSIAVASLSSLTVYLMPLIALILAYDTLVGEIERGTMLLLLAYPVARWQVIVGKFIGHVAILVLAVVLGYGIAGAVVVAVAGGDMRGLDAYLAMVANSALLGAVFVALGYLVSVLTRERSAAAGIALGLWIFMVVLYDLALLGVLVADKGQTIDQRLFVGLLLASPTDAYRIVSLTSSNAVAAIGGLAGIATRVGLGPGLPLAVMAAWVVLPLGAAMTVFQKKEL